MREAFAKLDYLNKLKKFLSTRKSGLIRRNIKNIEELEKLEKEER